MKSPERFPQAMNIAFGIGFSVYLIFGIVGFLMFGEELSPLVRPQNHSVLSLTSVDHQ